MLTNIIPQLRRLPLNSRPLLTAMYSSKSDGSGSSGGAGSIREAGGTFGKIEAAQEAQYFNKLQREQLSKLKDHLKDEISHHEAEIKRHQEAIAKQKKIQADLDKAPK